MKRKNKNRWYKSKGGWIGLGIYLALFLSLSKLREFPAGYLINSGNTFPYPNGGMIVIGLINITLYFIVGYFIQNKLLKRKK